MRFGLAIASLVLAGVLLILGIGQRTFLAGPREIVYTVALPEGADYGVLPAEDLASVPGQANAVVTGDTGFVAVGSTIDVEAWTASVASVRLAADTAERTVSGTVLEEPQDTADAAEDAQSGTADASDGAPAEDSAASDPSATAEGVAFNPRGSDLWIEEQDGAGRLALTADEDQSLLVSEGEDGSVSIAWAQDLRTPLAGPLMVAGGVFAVLGLILYLIAVDHDRRGLGPRRGKTGPLPGIRGWVSGRRTARSGQSDSSVSAERRSVRTTAAIGLGLVGALTFSGCSASYWPDFSSSPKADEEQTDASESNLAPVPITQAQIDRILTDVAAVAQAADDARDPALLETRFAGDALAQREANYRIRAAVADYEVKLPRITDEYLGYELVQSTEGWPRTVFVTVASQTEEEAAAEQAADATEPAEGSADAEQSEQSEQSAQSATSPSLALVLQQESPQDNYLVERIFALRGGINMPTAAPAEEGTALLADDLQTLALPPGEVGTAYAAILTGDTGSEQAKLFDLEGDSIIAKSGAAWVAAAKEAGAAAGTDVDYSVTAAQSDTPIVSLSTGVGGAIVATTVLESRVERQTGEYQPKAVGAFEALSGLSGRQEQMTSVVAHQLLFFVPSETSGDKIQLLGYATELVEAKN